LMEKLTALHFPSGFVIWLHDYLNERQQRVRIGNSKSRSLPVTSGVPQGSLLGPYLFLMMSHDFSASDPSCIVCQYANDTTVACPFRSYSDVDLKIKNEMLHMQQWSASNGFKLNSSKTQCLPISKRSCVNVFAHMSTLHLRDSIKLLGATWTSSLS
jgi:hypothetical protein